MIRINSSFAVVVSIFFLSCGGPDLPEKVALAYENLPRQLDFNQHIKPILSDKCFICHGPDKAEVKAGLQLHAADKAYAELPDSPGNYAIVPGNPGKSEMVDRILTEDSNIIMPKPESHLTLTDREKAMLVKWIEDGAEYKDHWAFIPPEEHEVPKVDEEAANPIDNFIFARLQEEKLSPSPRADKEILLRRLSFDLTGLPPTAEELDAFLSDDSHDAYEKQVNRLLASPHYGEQMALGWMDLSRYADTHGYSVDRYRNMSPWRDWVIKAFNENMPYNTFVTWQLAGDLMEKPTREMKLATAFNRIHPQNMEGGIVNEEFLIEYAVDRASTVGEAFMGLTVACARCHDHKYDPISHKNFYEMTSFFNNLNESGQISWNDAMPVPNMLLTTEEENQMIAYMNDLLKEAENEVESTKKSIVATDFEGWLKSNEHQKALKQVPTDQLVAYYTLDAGNLTDKFHPGHKGTMKRESREGQEINLVKGKKGDGIILDGDTWLDLKQTGVYGRNDKFSISLWAYIPKELKDGNIFHKGDGAILYNWRGYHLKIVNNRLEIMMAHTAPDNTITELTNDEFPRDRWVSFTMTYDGSSKADGLKLYIDGKEAATTVKFDNLYKDILFRRSSEPGLQLGARYRGKGIKGAVVDEIRVFEKELSALEAMQLAENNEVNALAEKVAAVLSPEEKKMLEAFYLGTMSHKIDRPNGKLARLRKAYVDSVENIQEIMVMKETPEPVQAYLLDRGVYDARAEEVFPKTPEAILPMPEYLPKNRLGFAKWLFLKDHPLTARVAVNRIWQHYFGKGLVKTSEDFGNQGEMPSHPALLDWLAIRFIETDWDMKSIQKMIVMSNTYQQSSIANEELMQKDVENRLLARGPSKRLTGEMLRDNALVASGLLNDTIGGESVKPYQPNGLWKVNGAEYKEDEGDKLYRRSMYTIWKRSVPHPTIATFDAPDRSICTVRRQETNTPLQALVLLNDPTYIEAARVLGEHMTKFQDPGKGISNAFRRLTGRKIKKEELQALLELKNEEYENFKSNPQKAHGWLNTGEFRIASDDDGALVAANAVVASTIMNADATITKR